jgi:hypothetical protein
VRDGAFNKRIIPMHPAYPVPVNPVGQSPQVFVSFTFAHVTCQSHSPLPTLHGIPECVYKKLLKKYLKVARTFVCAYRNSAHSEIDAVKRTFDCKYVYNIVRL